MKAGDTVRLKLGGPMMTVRGPSAKGGDYVVATWVENATRRGKSFSQAELERTDTRADRAAASAR